MKRKLVCILTLSFALMIFTISCGNSQHKEISLGEIDEKILDKSAEELKKNLPPSGFDNPYPDNRTFEVSKQKTSSEYVITVSLDKDPIDIIFPIIPAFAKIKARMESLGGMVSDIGNIDSKWDSTVAEAKNKIKKYVEQSTFISDKEQVCIELDKIELKSANFNSDVIGVESPVALFDVFDNAIYLNKDYEPCEYVLLHEYFHVLQSITSREHFENFDYPDQLYTEVLTDILTISLEPKINLHNIGNENSSAYERYYGFVYLFIGILGPEVINAYFYGYSGITDIIPENELFLLLGILESQANPSIEIAEYIFNACWENLVLKWGSKTGKLSNPSQ